MVKPVVSLDAEIVSHQRIAGDAKNLLVETQETREDRLTWHNHHVCASSVF